MIKLKKPPSFIC